MFKVLFYQPTFNLLILLYNLFGASLGLAIILIAALSRLVTYPITKTQLKTAKKSKEFQKKYDDLKKKYKKNQKKLSEELAKLQAQYLPGQLAGCLPIIVLFMLLVQVRGGIVNLVSQGWHAFNEVAYVESLKKEEESISFSPEEDLEIGEHTFKIKVFAENGKELEKEYKFEVVEDIGERTEEHTEAEKENSQVQKDEELEALGEQLRNERATDITIFPKTLTDNETKIATKKVLFITTRKKSIYLFEGKKPEFEFFVRAPSNQMIDTDKTEIFLDDEDVTQNSELNSGEAMNLKFFGMDLSKVAADFSLDDPQIVPYMVLGLLVGASQYATSQILSGIRLMKGEKKEKTEPKRKGKKAKDEEETPDMAEVMTMASKQMMIMLPVMTVFTSLGYLGGAYIFPSGISIFWTVQSLFVIIQQLITNRKETVLWIKTRFTKNKE